VYQGPNFPSDNTTRLLESLLKCEFSSNSGYLAHVSDKKPENRHLLSKNTRLWNSCVNQLEDAALCFSPEYLHAACQLYPVRLIKTVRMPMKYAVPLLESPSLNLKIILLTRDPRGTYNSRSTLAWCGHYCSNATYGCDKLHEDVATAKQLRSRFPGRIHLLRYEDLCVDPEPVTRGLLEFLDLPWSSGVEAFLKSHTTEEKVYVHKAVNNMAQRRRSKYGTAKNSKATAIAWKKEFGWTRVKEVQEQCKDFMDVMGYREVVEEGELQNDHLLLDKTAQEVWPKL